jgi:hypothetical protein
MVSCPGPYPRGRVPPGMASFFFFSGHSMGLIISVSLSAGPTRRPDLGEAAGSWSKWCAPPSPPVFQIRGQHGVLCEGKDVMTGIVDDHCIE